MTSKAPVFPLGAPIALDAIAGLEMPEFRHAVTQSVGSGARLLALLAQRPHQRRCRLLALLAGPMTGELSALATDVAGTEYPSLTPDCPQAHMFEREIAEQSAVTPTGHPWLKPLRYTASTVGVTDFFRVEGDEVHEVAVGPVHAGVIEPGHFRFQCHGELVLHLEIALGYQHRGVERALAGGPDKRSLHYAETLAGDTTIGHATAYCEAVESLARCQPPLRAQMLRAIALELERLANHTGDLGALANDVGFLPTASFCGRLRGEFLNLTALLCGNRFGRGLICPGGVAFDLDDARRDQLLARLEAAAADLHPAVQLLWDTPSVMARMDDVGVVSYDTCLALGLVGVAARACGVEQDARFEFPSGAFRFFQVPVSTWHSGDVFARAWVRWLETQRSLAFVQMLARNLAKGPLRAQVGGCAPEAVSVSVIEGWRGQICHVATTDAHGRFAQYKVVDPSFHNWTGLAMAMRGQAISDFPLCNKSFNLSYCGHDL